MRYGVNQVHYGNEFNKNSLNRILRNKRYIGVYTYRGTETPDGLPRIISDDLFYEVQDMMGKKKKPLRVQRLSKITY